MSDPTSAVAAGYDRLASRWDEWADAVHPPLRESYTARLDESLAPGSTVLELGCGTGIPVGLQLAARHEYLGVDVSSEMVVAAAANVPLGRFEVADMRTLDRPQNSLDAVVALFSIIHVPRSDQPALFGRIHDWLRPGGYLLASLTTGDLAEGWEDDWLEAGPMYWSGHDAATNLSLLREAGFVVIEAENRDQMEGDNPVSFQWIMAQRRDGN